ncbi:hypothetical protein Sru01_22470 [Sphaerisporangium rufum]|uniref:Peptidase C51 domain-containing protein n=1 Tax=Sphaerisporangium rufum TaxID=1381558 RepID=A0A919V4H5_9ACTN|nr:CHAP domain-containing protein [Sphaerisporangium rufum]GII77265.1 hypothetical protein Sru01_22470 [Sphaerisporangium rufum]
MFIHRLLDAPKKHLKACAFGGLLVAQIVAGTTLAARADTAADDPLTRIAGAEASQAKDFARSHTSAGKVSANTLLALARSQVGIAENAAGGGTKFHSWYMSHPRAVQTVARDGGSVAGFANAAWCDMFVSWVGTQLGLQDTVGVDAYTVEHAKWFAAQGRWGTAARPGAVVFFGWNGGKGFYDIDHVGFVLRDNGDGTIQTVEGNTDNGRVEIREREVAKVVGYGYPAYAA